MESLIKKTLKVRTYSRTIKDKTNPYFRTNCHDVYDNVSLYSSEVFTPTDSKEYYTYLNKVEIPLLPLTEINADTDFEKSHLTLTQNFPRIQFKLPDDVAIHYDFFIIVYVRQYDPISNIPTLVLKHLEALRSLGYYYGKINHDYFKKAYAAITDSYNTLTSIQKSINNLHDDNMPLNMTKQAACDLYALDALIRKILPTLGGFKYPIRDIELSNKVDKKDGRWRFYESVFPTLYKHLEAARWEEVYQVDTFDLTIT